LHLDGREATTGDLLAELTGQAPAAARIGPRPLTDPLSESELRVPRYLPTNLTVPQIARELSVSTHTVKTHMRNLYAKLGTHRRTETLARARDLGLLAPSGPRRSDSHSQRASSTASSARLRLRVCGAMGAQWN
jgi:LuxR family transcriptional regulator, maltose regulon positive regulatory protein